MAIELAWLFLGTFLCVPYSAWIYIDRKILAFRIPSGCDEITIKCSAAMAVRRIDDGTIRRRVSGCDESG